MFGSGSIKLLTTDPTLVFSSVSEPVCSGAAPALGIFHPEPAPGKREHNVGISVVDPDPYSEYGSGSTHANIG